MMSRPKLPPPRSQHSRNEMLRDSGDDEEIPQLRCHLWAKDVKMLLDDETGCVLFEKFLKEEECDLSDLYFVYACRGLRLEHEPSKRDRCARAIYKKSLKSGRVRAVSDEVKDAIAQHLEDVDIYPELFDEAVHQVMESMMKTTFARFIQSDVYISHVQHAESFGETTDSTPSTECEDLNSSRSPVPLSSDSVEDFQDSSTSTSRKECSDSTGRFNSRIDDVIDNDNNNDRRFANQMPTLDENEESTLLPPRATISRKPGHVLVPPPRPPQSKTMLMKRQSQRGLKYMEQIDQPSFRQPPNPYHVNNSCFVPPSAYHSDMQSMSSGNYTDLDTDGKRVEHDRRHCGDIDRRKSQRKITVNVRDHLANFIPRTRFPIIRDAEIANHAEKNPREFHRILCERLERVLGDSTEDEVQNQSILDNHVQRVFKTPPVQTPKAASPPLERQILTQMGLKSPYQMNPGPLRNVNNNRHVEIDSAIYTCGSGFSSTAPLALPRGRNYPVVDSGCDDSVLNAPASNQHESVRDWFTRNSHEPTTSRGKNKASICSGSNRSSKSGQDYKKKNQSSNKESEMVVGYHYDGDTHPFVIRLPQKNLRLKDFKAHLTRKGSFRYFFKSSMDDFGTNGVYEEVKDDNQVLPLWDGKVFSRIVPAEHSNSNRTLPEVAM